MQKSTPQPLRLFRITFGDREAPRLVLEVYARSHQEVGDRHDNLKVDPTERMVVKPVRDVPYAEAMPAVLGVRS